MPGRARRTLPSTQELYAQLGADPNSGAYRLGETVPELLVPGGWASRGGRGVRGLLGSLRQDSKDDAVSCASGNSFVRGTRVLMADGSHKPIEDIRIGDLVWASDPETGEEGPRTVLATIVCEGVKTLVEITVDTTTQIDAATLDQADLPDGPARPGPTVLGNAIIATDGHPFWVPLLGEWVDAVDLVPGMWFLSSEGTLVQVTSTRVWTEPERVHNLTVQDFHTYYVLTGEIPLLVHNCNLAEYADSVRNEPGVKFASEYTSPPGTRYYGHNRPGQQAEGSLANALERVGHHGGCAEVHCLIQAQSTEGSEAIRGGNMRTVRTRNNSMPTSNTSGHGEPDHPCGRCVRLLEELGIS